MLTLDPIYVRASVTARCNLACIYCSKGEGMENRVPAHLAGQDLGIDEYCANLEHLARNGLRGVSFTGGEPTLNPALPALVARAAEIFDRVELTTNGRFLLDMLPALTPHLDVLKVSLDAVDPQIVRAITKGTDAELNRAVASIRAGCAAGLRVGVNVVVMRSTADQIDGIIDLVRALNAEGYPGTAYVSLLDFYYSDERRAVWQQEFFPIEELAASFAACYGPSEAQERFGCRFFWFDADGVQVRFKDSYGATHRAAKCGGCRRYCQEGIYGLKHSAEGWVTTCPTGDPAHGVQLMPGLAADDADRMLAPLLRDIRLALPNRYSFATLLETHDLHLNANDKYALEIAQSQGDHNNK
jgi:molybdenum cofactor biosynthesis enzyme MoaA